MKSNTSYYICITFFLFFWNSILTQQISLQITSKLKSELDVLATLDYQKKHKDSVSIQSEITKVSKFLKNSGYFTLTIDSVLKNENIQTAYISLQQKIENARIKIRTEHKPYFKDFEIVDNIVTLPIIYLENTLSNVTKELDSQGKSFSKVQLKKIAIKENTLFAVLEIKESEKRTINKVIIKDYESFPISFLKNYFTIQPNTVFTQQKIKEISEATKTLPFVSEIKPPEVLFTNDSTFLYLYFKKLNNNSFDGIVNFASKEDGGILFNGNIDLQLNNILNTGERFAVFWNSIGEERQEFKLATEIPYVFNTKVSPQVAFSIYKQDSTFINTKLDAKLWYHIHPRIKLGVNYSSENSENLIENNIGMVTKFNNYFVGFQLEYSKPKKDFFLNDTFHLYINPTIGKRTTGTNASNQFKIEASASYIWDISLKGSIYIKNSTGLLNSDSFVDNELFRIGGANSVRGFNEQSIFTSRYSYFNIEYRYLTSQKSYFYSITDLGRVKTTFNNQNLLGLGLGYLFTNKNSQINISTSIGKTDTQNFNFNNSKLIIGWKNYF